MKNMQFSECNAMQEKLKEYKKDSDSTQQFLEDTGYIISIDKCVFLKRLYSEYQDYCKESGLRPVSLKIFGERIRRQGIEIKRMSTGRVVYIECTNETLKAALNE